MPYDDPDATDPMTLRGVVVQTEDDRAVREMAECFIEEYARLGFDSDRILRMFKTRGYAGPFMAYEALGEAAIRALIAGQMSLRTHYRPSAMSPGKANGDITLPVLDR